MTQKPFGKNILNFLSQKCKSLNQLKQIHANLLTSHHLHENPFSIAPLLSSAGTSGGVHNRPAFFSYARLIFSNLLHRNTFMYNSMIRGYVQSNSPIRAISCYLDMINQGLVANNYTFPPLIKASTLIAPDLNRIGRLVHAHAVISGFGNDPFVVSTLIEFYSLVDIKTARVMFNTSSEKDVVVWTAMVDAYGKMGDIVNARKMFKEMPKRNSVSWSAIMAAYSRANDFKEVLSLFKQMQESGTNPNESGLVSVLTACAHLGASAQGLWLHSYAKRFNLKSNTILATAIVDMYSKCGWVESALSVFEAISDKDSKAWNAIISGVALNGDVKKSLELFNKMVRNKNLPTDTTFISVLTACTHAKMVDTGLQIFDQMSDIYEVELKIEHYACVVDLMARAGLVEEAEKFIEEKMIPFGGGAVVDVNVWGALLGACRVYGKVEVGNRIWRKLCDLDVNDPGARVLSYNIYKEAGWNKEAKRVREVFGEGRMKKKPGCSVIEVDGMVHEFLAGALCHPWAKEMCKVLEGLSKHGGFG